MTEGRIAWAVLIVGLLFLGITVMTGHTTTRAYDANGNAASTSTK